MHLLRAHRLTVLFFCLLRYRSCPLLLTATSGSVEALDYMLSAGADWRRRDSKGNDVVQLAALYFHPKVLRHLISLGLPDLPVWKILVGTLPGGKDGDGELASERGLSEANVWIAGCIRSMSLH